MRQLQPRDLVWDGCLNVRDLGGLPTRDGHETRLGAIVRADSVRQLSGDGWQALIDHGGYPGVKEKGLLRLEGKEYVVKDGDTLVIRHS